MNRASIPGAWERTTAMSEGTRPAAMKMVEARPLLRIPETYSWGVASSTSGVARSIPRRESISDSVRR